MIEIFTLNSKGKIELTQDKLKELLDKAYWEGYYANNHTWTWRSPSITSPYYYSTASNSSITLTSSDLTSSNATCTTNLGSDATYTTSLPQNNISAEATI